MLHTRIEPPEREKTDPKPEKSKADDAATPQSDGEATNIGAEETPTPEEDEVEKAPDPLPIDAVAYARSGNSVLCIAGGAVYELSTDTLEIQKRTEIACEGVRCMAVSRDSSSIAVGLRDGSISILEAGSYSATHSFLAHTKAVNVVAFSPDGTRFASGSDDITVRVWDLGLRERIGKTFERHNHSVGALAFSPDGSSIVSASWDRTVRLWTIGSGEQVGESWMTPSALIFLDYAQKGKRIIAALATEYGWRTKRANMPPEDEARVFDDAIFFSSIDTGYAWATNVSMQIWRADVLGRKQAPVSGHTTIVRSVSFSHDGKRIVSGSHDTTIRIWDAETGKSLKTFEEMKHDSLVNTVAFSPDPGERYIVSGGKDSTIRIWDAKTGQLLHSLEGHTRSILCSAFTADGSVIATGSHDKTIRLWDVSTAAAIGAPLVGHSDTVWGVALTPDGRVLVSTSQDSTIRFWDVPGACQIGESIICEDGVGLHSLVLSVDGTSTLR